MLLVDARVGVRSRMLVHMLVELDMSTHSNTNCISSPFRLKIRIFFSFSGLPDVSDVLDLALNRWFFGRKSLSSSLSVNLGTTTFSFAGFPEVYDVFGWALKRGFVGGTLNSTTSTSVMSYGHVLPCANRMNGRPFDM